MKKIVSLFAFCLLVFTMQAQDRFSYSVELEAGLGIGRGPLVVAAPQFVASYDLGNGFSMGAGVGFRYSMPQQTYYTVDGKRSNKTPLGLHGYPFGTELDIPVFLRFGYGRDRLFAALDAGYSVGLVSSLGEGYLPDGITDPYYDGFFVNPHIGWKFGRHSALALGVLLQQCVIAEHNTVTRGGTSIKSGSQTHRRFPAAITLRYAFAF